MLPVVNILYRYRRLVVGVLGTWVLTTAAAAAAQDSLEGACFAGADGLPVPIRHRVGQQT